MRTGKLSAESLQKISGFEGLDFGPNVRVISLDLSDGGFDLGKLIDKLVRLSSLDTADLAGTIDIANLVRGHVPTKLKKIFKNVYNGCSKETENFLYATIQELGMNVKDVSLMFGSRSAAGKLDNGALILSIDEDLPFESRQYVILHELRHIQQIQRGWLVATPNGDNTYKGRVVECDPKKHPSNLSYCMEPHELDANIFAMSYFRGNLKNVESGENAIGVAKEYTRRVEWFESIGVP